MLFYKVRLCQEKRKKATFKNIRSSESKRDIFPADCPQIQLSCNKLIRDEAEIPRYTIRCRLRRQKCNQVTSFVVLYIHFHHVSVARSTFLIQTEMSQTLWDGLCRHPWPRRIKIQTSILVYDQKPGKIMTFPSAPAALCF